MNIFLALNFSFEQSFYKSTPHSIKELFLNAKIPEIISILEKEDKFKESDLPFVSFVLKYFIDNKITKTKESFFPNYSPKNTQLLSKNYSFPMICSLTEPLSLMMLNSYILRFIDEKTHLTIGLKDLMVLNIDILKKVNEDFLNKPYRRAEKFYYKSFENYPEKVNEYHRYALSGEESCALKLLKYLQNNLEEAYKYYNFLSKSDNPKACSILGNIYFYGLGVDKNLFLAKHFFQVGARRNDVESLNGLGRYYTLSNNLDERNALNNYMKSHFLGSQEGTYFYKIYNKIVYKVKTLEENTYPEKIDFLPLKIELIDKYNVNETFDKSLILANQVLEETQDFEDVEKKAFQYFKEQKYEKCFIILAFCIEAGNYRSVKNLINFYYKKRFKASILANIFNFIHKLVNQKKRDSDYTFIDKIDFDKFFFNLLKDFKHPTICHTIGYCYYHGIGTQKNMRKSLSKYCISSLKNSTIGKFNFAYMIAKGDVYKPNLRKSIELLARIKNIMKFEYVFIRSYSLVVFLYFYAIHLIDYFGLGQKRLIISIFAICLTVYVTSSYFSSNKKRKRNIINKK